MLEISGSIGQHSRNNTCPHIIHTHVVTLHTVQDATGKSRAQVLTWDTAARDGTMPLKAVTIFVDEERYANRPTRPPAAHRRCPPSPAASPFPPPHTPSFPHRAPQVMRELAARYQTEVLVPHDADHPPEQRLCARAKRSLETTAATIVMCDLPIEVHVCR